MKVNFLGLLTILFIGLKLTHYIDWSWLLVLLPIYLLPASLIIFAVIIGIVCLVFIGIDMLVDWVRK